MKSRGSRSFERPLLPPVQDGSFTAVNHHKVGRPVGVASDHAGSIGLVFRDCTVVRRLRGHFGSGSRHSAIGQDSIGVLTRTHIRHSDEMGWCNPVPESRSGQMCEARFARVCPIRKATRRWRSRNLEKFWAPRGSELSVGEGRRGPTVRAQGDSPSTRPRSREASRAWARSLHLLAAEHLCEDNLSRCCTRSQHGRRTRATSGIGPCPGSYCPVAQ